MAPIADDEALLRVTVGPEDPALLEDDNKAVVTADGVEELPTLGLVNLDKVTDPEAEDKDGA